MEDNKKKLSIDVFTLIKLLLNDRKKLCIYACVAGFIGAVLSFGVPRIYKTSVMLAPESSSGGLMGNISSLASMVGMDMNFGDSEDAIYPEIYPDLMQSTDFLVSLFDVRVVSKDKKIDTNLFDYMYKKQKMAWWEYPFALLSDFIKKLKSEDNGAGDGKYDPFCLTKDQFGIAKAISNSISCDVDKKTSVITISTEAQDPLIAAQLADSVKSRLQVFITNYRTQKARNDVAYMEKLFDEAHDQYVKARQLYATFSDANQELTLQSYRTKQDDLENEMQLKYNIYTQVAEQLQLAKAKVQERTPAFTIVQNSTVPVKHSNKPKLLWLIGFGFLGFVIRMSMVAWRNKNMLFSF